MAMAVHAVDRGAFLTAGYMGRLVWIVFFGEPKSDAASHAHESGVAMLLPLIVLAVLSVVGGWLNVWPEHLAQFIQQSKEALHHVEGYDAMHHTVLIWGSAAWIVGLAGSLFFYGLGAKTDRLEQVAKPVYDVSQSPSVVRRDLWFLRREGSAAPRRAVELSRCIPDQGHLRPWQCRLGRPGRRMCSRSLHVGNLHGYVYWFLAGFMLLWALAAGVL